MRRFLFSLSSTLFPLLLHWQEISMHTSSHKKISSDQEEFRRRFATHYKISHKQTNKKNHKRVFNSILILFPLVDTYKDFQRCLLFPIRYLFHHFHHLLPPHAMFICSKKRNREETPLPTPSLTRGN